MLNPLDLLRGGNSISPAAPQPEVITEASTKRQAPLAAPSAPIGADPTGVQSRYYIETGRGGERRYYTDVAGSDLAFRAGSKALTTAREDAATVRDMLDVAQTRGWTTVHLKGSAPFRQEAWIEASARGIEVRGYEPTQDDRREASRRQTTRQEAPAKTQNAIEAVSAVDAAASAGVADPQPSRAEATPSLPDAAKLSPGGREVLDFVAKRLVEAPGLDDATRARLTRFAASELMRHETARGPVPARPAQSRERPQREAKPARNRETQAPGADKAAKRSRSAQTAPEAPAMRPRV